MPEPNGSGKVKGGFVYEEVYRCCSRSGAVSECLFRPGGSFRHRDGYGFQAAGSAVVAEVHAGHATQGIAHAGNAEAVEGGGVHRLRGYGRRGGATERTGGHHGIVQGVAQRSYSLALQTESHTYQTDSHT